MLVDPQPAAVVERKAELGDQGVRAHARRPDDRVRRHPLAVGELDTSRIDRGQDGRQPHVEAAPDELPGRVLAEPSAKVVQDVVGGVGQEPSSGDVAEGRVVAARVAHEVLELGHRLDARVAAADEDERQPPLAFAWIVDCRGELELLEHVVSQVDRLGDRLEPDRMLDQPRDRRRARDRAQRDDERVELLLERIALDRLHRRRASGHVDRRRAAQEQPRTRAHDAHGHDGVARLDRAGRRLRKKRRVEHVVARVDQRHLDLPCPLSEHPGDVASGEPGSEDQYAHRLQHRTTVHGGPSVYASADDRPALRRAARLRLADIDRPCGRRNGRGGRPHRRLHVSGRLGGVVLVAGGLLPGRRSWASWGSPFAAAARTTPTRAA